jgi:hypothetical protein
MKIVTLPIKKKWFDMILSGEKKEEYRELKPYWDKRLSGNRLVLKLVNGYGKHRPYILIDCLCHKYGIGKPEWGAPSYKVHILCLGQILNTDNLQEIKP